MPLARITIALLVGTSIACAAVPAPAPTPPAPPRDTVTAGQAFDRAQTLAADDPRAALGELDRAIVADPEHILARIHAAELRLALGEEGPRADRELAIALKLAPDNARAHLAAGQLAAQLGDPTRAEQLLTRAATLKPDWAEAHVALSEHWSRVGKTDDAIVAGRRALELSPDRLDLTMRLVDLLAGVGKLEEAARTLEAAAARIGKSAPLFRRAAELWERATKPADAERLRKLADVIDPPPTPPKKRALPPARKR